MARLRTVAKGETRRVVPKQLRAKTAFTVMLSNGQEALGMVSDEGLIYFTGDNGWVPMDMTQEVTNDPTV